MPTTVADGFGTFSTPDHPWCQVLWNVRSRGFAVLLGLTAALAGCTSSTSAGGHPTRPNATPLASSGAPATAKRVHTTAVGFPERCHIQPKVDGLPSDTASGEPRAIIRAVHARCFAVLGSRSEDAVLAGDRRVVVGVHWPTADAKGQRLFFFDHHRLLGQDTSGYLPMVVSAEATNRDAFVARYFGVGSYPGPAAGGGGGLTVRFTWHNTARPEPIDPLPSATYPRCPQPDLNSKHLKAHKRGRATCFF